MYNKKGHNLKIPTKNLDIKFMGEHEQNSFFD